MASTITLLSIIDYAKTFIRMAPLTGAGGVANEPGLSLCNDVLQSLLSAPYDWKFNKFAIPTFTTIPYQQDYRITGCQMNIITSQNPPSPVCIVHLNTTLSANGPGLSQSGNLVTALFSDFAPNGTFGLNGPPGSTPVTTGTSIPAAGNLVTIKGALQSGYNVTNAVITNVTKSPNGGITGVQFTIIPTGLANDGGQGIGNVNWVTSAQLQDYMNTATIRPITQIEVVSGLPLESVIQPPYQVCLQIEEISNNVTTLLFRFRGVPSTQIWNTFIFYQGKAPIKSRLLDNWSPWPDELGYVLRSGIKSKAYEFFEDPRQPMAEQKWQFDLGKALDIKDQEARSEQFFPSRSIMLGG